jgi:hypothetical protein
MINDDNTLLTILASILTTLIVNDRTIKQADASIIYNKVVQSVANYNIIDENTTKIDLNELLIIKDKVLNTLHNVCSGINNSDVKPLIDCESRKSGCNFAVSVTKITELLKTIVPTINKMCKNGLIHQFKGRLIKVYVTDLIGYITNINKYRGYNLQIKKKNIVYDSR